MKLAPTIRSHIEDYIKEKGYKLQQFSNTCGVNVGTLSAIIKGSRPLAMNQLDQITSAMGLEKGHFYEMYSVECFVEAAPHWRRLEPFLYRCAELNKLGCIKKVIISVTDDRSYIEELFEVAEDLYNKGMKQAAFILYECVAECEKYQHSERLALCQYRIFLLSCGSDQKIAMQAATRFELFVDRLEEEYQLDALKDLANLYSALHNFDRLYPITINLERLAKIMMSHIKQDTTHTKRKTVYPLFVYQGYSLLLRASCCSKIGKYEEALECTRTYYELTLIEPNEEDILYIEKFRKWGKINIYLYRLMMGQNEVLEDYIEHVENEYEGEYEEILVAIFNIVQIANRFKYDVNFILERFKDKINLYHIGSRHEGEYSEQNWNTRLVNFFYELAVYYLSRSSYESGMKALISSMELSINISNDPYLIKCVNLYGEYRRFANEEINVKYQQILQSNNIA